MPTTEEQLKKATVGELKPLHGRVHLAPYDRQWPSMFEHQHGRIREILGSAVILLEHVGSTSVPGLSAKPIIDMVLAVPDSTDEPAYVPLLEKQSYLVRIREPDWFEHRLFKAPDMEVNLHVFSQGCSEIEQMLMFRDWLRNHDDDRDTNEAEKKLLAAKTWKYVQNYADAKSAVIQRILEKARPSHTESDVIT